MASEDRKLPPPADNQTYVEVSALNGGWVTLPEMVRVEYLHANTMLTLFHTDVRQQRRSRIEKARAINVLLDPARKARI